MKTFLLAVGTAAVVVALGSIAVGAVQRAESVHFDDVQAAVKAAQDGDTVAIPGGNTRWKQTLRIRKAITIKGAGPASTIIVNEIDGFGMKAQPLFSLEDGGGPGPRRVTGIRMQSDHIVNAPEEKQGIGVSAYGYGTLKRIDDCEFNDLFTGVLAASANGVTDHNTYRNCTYAWRHVGYASSPEDGKSGQQFAWDKFRPVAFDSLNYFFHEDESVEMSAQSYACEVMEANSVVVRRCKFVLREPHVPYHVARSSPLFDIHGDDPDSKKYAALAALIYDNRVVINNGATMTFVALSGGSALIFNNRVVSYRGRGSAIVQLREERNEHGEKGVSKPLNPKLGVWPAWDDKQYEDVVHDAFIAQNSYNGTEQGPSAHTYSKRLVVATDKNADPAANAYTTLPKPLVTPPYPHPLVREAAASGTNASKSGS